MSDRGETVKSSPGRGLGLGLPIALNYRRASLQLNRIGVSGTRDITTRIANCTRCQFDRVLWRETPIQSNLLLSDDHNQSLSHSKLRVMVWC